MLLSCQNIEYSYLVEPILKGISFHINVGEQTAIVGVNGAGKTTLFKVLTQQISPDAGNIYISNDVSLGYLAQSTDYASSKSVFDELYCSNQKILDLDKKIKDYETHLKSTSHPSESTLIDYHQTIEHYESLNGYGYESQVKGVLKGLGFVEDQFVQIVDTLSGGQKTRLALGKLLLIAPDLLLLDEPTNHLDLDAIRWLEGYLSSYKGTLLIISHDRYFLDKIVTKIIDIEFGKANVYKGNYSTFIEKKEFKQTVAHRQFEQQQAEIKRQEEIIRKLRSYSTEKFIKRAVSREKVLDKMDIIDKPLHLQDNMNLTLNPKRESGMDVLRIKDLAMGFTDKKLFEQLDLDVYKGDKIALIGNNGTGKTTLFKILMGDIKPNTGKFKLGSSVELAYYDQEHSTLHEEFTLVEEIAQEFPTMEISKIRNLLASFLFTGDDAFKLVSTLSGGERGRLSLAKLMLSKGNFLLLDEPTNHLDMISKEVLENALRHYTGTILFISHDRYFINRVATKVFELTPSGTTLYQGNYDYYLEKKSEFADVSLGQAEEVQTKSKSEWLDMKNQQKEAKKLQNQIDSLEAEIESLENDIRQIDEDLLKEEIFKDYEKSNHLLQQKTSLEEKLEKTIESWENLLSSFV